MIAKQNIANAEVARVSHRVSSTSSIQIDDMKMSGGARFTQPLTIIILICICNETWLFGKHEIIKAHLLFHIISQWVSEKGDYVASPLKNILLLVGDVLQFLKVTLL